MAKFPVLRIMRIVEKIWLLAAIIGVGIGLFRWINSAAMSKDVYTPWILAAFCLMAFFMKHKQRLFMEKMEANK